MMSPKNNRPSLQRQEFDHIETNLIGDEDFIHDLKRNSVKLEALLASYRHLKKQHELQIKLIHNLQKINQEARSNICIMQQSLQSMQYKTNAQSLRVDSYTNEISALKSNYLNLETKYQNCSEQNQILRDQLHMIKIQFKQLNQQRQIQTKNKQQTLSQAQTYLLFEKQIEIDRLNSLVSSLALEKNYLSSKLAQANQKVNLLRMKINEISIESTKWYEKHRELSQAIQHIENMRKQYRTNVKLHTLAEKI